MCRFRAYITFCQGLCYALTPPLPRSTVSLNQGQMLAVLNALPDPVFVLTASGSYAGLFGHADPNYYHDGSDLMGCRLKSPTGCSAISGNRCRKMV